MSQLQRKWLAVSLGEDVDVSRFHFGHDKQEVDLATVEVEVALLQKSNDFRGELDGKELDSQFKNVS